jgi:hypothetical protein
LKETSAHHDHTRRENQDSKDLALTLLCPFCLLPVHSIVKPYQRLRVQKPIDASIEASLLRAQSKMENWKEGGHIQTSALSLTGDTSKPGI